MTHDYLKLIERIRAALPANSRAHEDCDQLEVFCRAHVPVDIASDEWRDMKLTPVESRMAAALLSRLGKTVSRDQLFDAAWFDRDEPNPKSLDVCICKLRKKLESGHKYRIETIWGIGFRMVEGDGPSVSYPLMWAAGRGKKLAEQRDAA